MMMSSIQRFRQIIAETGGRGNTANITRITHADISCKLFTTRPTKHFRAAQGRKYRQGTPYLHWGLGGSLNLL